MTGGYSLRPKLAKELEEGAKEVQRKYLEDNIEEFMKHDLEFQMQRLIDFLEACPVQKEQMRRNLDRHFKLAEINRKFK